MLDSKRLWIGIGASLLLALVLSACASYPQVKAPEPTNTPLPAAPTEPPATATVPVPTAVAPAPPTATAVPPTEAPASAPSAAGSGDAQAGATVYASNCAACHGQKGEGVLGPKLAGISLSAEEIVTIVKNGKTGSGMPSFGGKLGDQDIQDLAAFILSLGK